MEITAIVGGFLTLAGMITGAYIYVGSHANKKDKHPDTKDIMYRDVCAQVQRTAQIERNNNSKAVAEVHSHLTARFDDLRTDMKEGFSEIKSLIGGKS